MYKADFSHLSAVLGYDELVLRHIIKQAPSYYRPFHLILVKGSKTKTRHIDSPGKKSALHVLQKRINKRLLIPEIGLLPANMVGSIKGKDLFKHLEPHVGKETVVCMDLQSCFPHITQQRVFNVWKYDFGYSSELAKALTQITTLRGYLPQGPPSSPLLCNFVLRKMANEIAALCELNALDYTQYVDDICISGDSVVARAMISEVHKIATKYGQSIKDIKTDIMDSRHRQKSAGGILNHSLKLPRGYANLVARDMHSIKDRGLITTGEKLNILGRILYIQHFSKEEAIRLKVILNDMLHGLSELDQDFPKAGNVKRCFHALKNRYNDSRCPHL